MAGLSGLIISCTPAVGRSARFYTRFSVRWCQALVDEHSYGSKGKLLEEVRFWEQRMEEHANQLIRHSTIVAKVFLRSDDMGHLTCGTVHKNVQVFLSEWEKKCSSTYRELKSIEHALTLA